MVNIMKIKNSILPCLILIFPINAYAYIDPGSGSALITAILGFFAAIIYSFKRFFYNLKDKFKFKSESESKDGKDKFESEFESESESESESKEG